jgi:hypothetical protein
MGIFVHKDLKTEPVKNPDGDQFLMLKLAKNGKSQVQEILIKPVHQFNMLTVNYVKNTYLDVI